MDVISPRRRGWTKRISCSTCWAQLNVGARDLEPIQRTHATWKYDITCPECRTRLTIAGEDLRMSPLQLKHLHNRNYEEI